MVNIDGSDGWFDGVFQGLIAGKPAPTGIDLTAKLVGAGLPAMRP
jgi:hypothetical protein